MDMPIEFLSFIPGFLAQASDLENDLAEEWIGTPVIEERFIEFAQTHFGASKHAGVALFNRSAAGIVSTLLAMVSKEDRILAIAPKGRPHPSIRRGASLAGAELVELDPDEGLELSHFNDTVMTILTRVTSELDILNPEQVQAVIAMAKEAGSTVFVDDAYGTRVGPALLDQKKTLALGVDFGIGEGGVSGLQGHRDGQRFLALAEGFALEYIEQLYPGDQLLVGAPGGSQHGIRRGVCIHHEGEITLDRLQRRNFQQGPRRAAPGPRRRDHVKEDLEGGDRTAQIVIGRYVWVQFAETRDFGFAEPHHAGPSRVVPGGRVAGDTQVSAGRAGGRKRDQRVRLGVERIHVAGRRRPVPVLITADTEPRRHKRLAVWSRVGILRADFEQSRIAGPARAVASGGGGQIGQHAGPHDIEIGADRIADA